MRPLWVILAEVDAIPGWFERVDALVFLAIGSLQLEIGPRGNILEIGAFEGKSAVLLGHMLGAADELLVCDIFEDEGMTAESRREWRRDYSGLKQSVFERNYRAVHGRIPRIHRGPSTSLQAGDLRGAFRFAHIDGSHAFEHVVEDVSLARGALAPGGIAAFDDISRSTTPGVALAVWSSVASQGLVPLALTRNKLYAAWSPVPNFAERLEDRLRTDSTLCLGYQTLGPHRVLMIDDPRRRGRGGRLLAAWTPPAIVPIARGMRRQLMGIYHRS